MDIIKLLGFFGGIAFFMFGMKVMSSGLEKTAGGKLEQMLGRMTATTTKGILFGLVLTATIQSSSAVTVMLVGLVNSSLMSFSSTIPVIMGTNIGTTVTSWILSLSGLGDDNLFVSLLKPTAFSPVLAFVGIILFSLSKRERLKDIGYILIGFAVLMYGMELMKTSVEPLTKLPEFQKILIAFSNPLFAVLAGAAFTAVIQSSSASVGVLQAIAISGAIPYSVAVPLIVGQNIGTCITSVIASFGVNKSAKRVVAIHLMFNIFGSIPFLAIYYLLCLIPSFPFNNAQATAFDIALIHTLLNVFSTVVLLPFIGLLDKLAVLIIKDGSSKERFLDKRLLATPVMALKQSKDKCDDMLKKAAHCTELSFSLLDKFDEKVFEQVLSEEKTCDEYRTKLNSFLIELTQRQLTQRDNALVTSLLNSVTEAERISDYAVSVAISAKSFSQNKKSLSKKGESEFENIISDLKSVIADTYKSFSKSIVRLAGEVKSRGLILSEEINISKDNHTKRLTTGECSADYAIITADLLNDFLRICAHCDNICDIVLKSY